MLKIGTATRAFIYRTDEDIHDSSPNFFFPGARYTAFHALQRSSLEVLI